MRQSPCKGITITALTALAAVFSSCSSTVQTRIERNPGVFDSLTSSQQDAVQQGRITRGLPKGGVFIAWGGPNHVSRGQRDGKSFERWRYKGFDPVYVTNIGVHYGHGHGHGYGYGYGSGYGYGTDVYYRPYTAAVVDFDQHDRVANWETVKRQEY
jgi:hypothetical protein